MRGSSWCGPVGVVVLVLMMLLAAHATPVKRDIGDILEGKEKRPFCNAFTGCGKKRSEAVGEVSASAELDALAKHVLAEAKLWEQLQNKIDMMRSLSARLEDHPVFRRKRSPAPLKDHAQKIDNNKQ